MIIQGDCLETLKTLEDNSIDAVVTDPPYGLSFMNRKWDYDVPSTEIWEECLRVLKPGGYLLAFAGTRTQHRMAVRIEDAGFEIRDMIAWVYSSGFPKSLNIGKAVDKLQGNEREVIGFQEREGRSSGILGNKVQITRKLSQGKSKWEGWGTALKPALEPITVARKPLGEKTVAENCLKWGVGGINIDECRVEAKPRKTGTKPTSDEATGSGNSLQGSSKNRQAEYDELNLGRFPANLIHDGSDEVVDLFPDSKSGNGKSSTYEKAGGQWGKGKQIRNADFGDSGSAARFFYCAKASKKDRDEGLEGFEEKEYGKEHYSTARLNDLRMEGEQQRLPNKNNHPTVKPTALMRYLVKLVTPPGGTVLDPFTGSGSTGKACKLEGFDFIGIEREEEYIKIAEARIKALIKP